MMRRRFQDQKDLHTLGNEMETYEGELVKTVSGVLAADPKIPEDLRILGLVHKMISCK